MKRCIIIAYIFISNIFLITATQQSKDITQVAAHNNIIPVVVIGSGPAGFTAAMYTARAQLPTTVFTGKKRGGTLTEAAYVENWPSKKKMSGKQIMDELEKQATHFGVQIVPEVIRKVDFSSWPFSLWTDEGEKISALSVIIATGGNQRTLDVPGVQKYWGKGGVRICTICDAPFDKGKDVAIIGGNDTSVDKALQLSKFTKNIMMIVEEKTMPATAVLKSYIKKVPKIKVLKSTQLKEVVGNEKTVTGIKLINKATGEETQLPVQAVYFALGFEPNAKLFQHQLELNENGYIIVQGKMQKTSVDGIFAAGNVEDNIYQKAATSAGRGAQAGMDAIEFLQGLGVNKKFTNRLQKALYEPKQKQSKDIPQITTEKELQELISKNNLVVVDFYSPYCTACTHMLPILKEVAAYFNDRAQIVEVDISKAPSLKTQYHIEQIPTLALFKAGKRIKTNSKLFTRRQMIEFIQQAIDKEK